jgi:hypothetical protein
MVRARRLALWNFFTVGLGFVPEFGAAFGFGTKTAQTFTGTFDV